MMRRMEIVVLALTATFGIFTLVQSSLASPPESLLKEKTELVDTKHNVMEVAAASYRLAYHSRMAAIESLIITKNSINLVFGRVI